MSELLINHAKRALWQAPRQDHQFNIGLARLTRNGGFIGSTKVLWHRVLNPTRNQSPRYYHHVYQIGQISTLTLNLANMLDTDYWMAAKDIVDEYNVFIEVYFESGAVVPLEFVWVMKDHKNNLLLAVRIQRDFDYGTLKHINEFSDEVSFLNVNTDNDKLITRFYTNALGNNLAFNKTSSRSHDTVSTITSYFSNQSHWVQFKKDVEALKAKYNGKGGALWYRDGFLVNESRSYHSDMLGHRYTVVWDETFKFRQFFKLQHLPYFKSKKDRGYNKYLLVCDAAFDEIDFFDDVDFYLVKGNESVYEGIYINRSMPRFIRQVAHNAYSVDASLVEKYVNLNMLFEDISECSIMVQARSGGSVKPTFSQANRIDELYRLPYDKILEAFYNVNSLVPEWYAANLENSGYIELMSSESSAITPNLVTRAYGYTGIVTELAYPKCPIIDGRVVLPDSLCIEDEGTGKGNRTLFIYNEVGLLVGTVYSEALSKSLDVSNFTTKGYAECFRMKLKQGNDKLSVYHNQNVSNMNLEYYGFSCYVCPEDRGRPSEDWLDVTGTNFYSYANGELTWHWTLLTQSNLYPCVKINDEVIVQLAKPVRNEEVNYLSVTFTGMQDYYHHNLVKPLNVPVATLDVFVNGEYMIEGVDYYLEKNYPHVVIVNAWANNIKNPQVILRGYGLANPETSKPYPPYEVGFVTDGYLSHNGQYDVSKHRPNNLVINSRVVEQGTYKFSEYDEGVKYPVDGRPYMLRDYIIPIEHLAGGSSAELYGQMVDIDLRVSKYLNEHVLEPTKLKPSIRTERWSLISPVCAAILADFAKGYMSDDTIPADFTLTDVNSYFNSYRSLLKYDPGYHNADSRYTYVRPHALSRPVPVTVAQWRFLNSVNSIYLNGVIDFTSFVTIGNQ